MKLDPSVKEKYPGFIAAYALVSGLTIEPAGEGLIDRKRQVFSDLKARYGSIPVIDIPEAKLYRALFKAMNADPSSYRPAPEYLLRRALDDRFPAINNLVDSCLLVTVEHWVTAGVYDFEKIKGEAVTALASEPKPFELINGRRLSPKPGEIILRDDEKLLSSFTLGDAKAAMITPKTTNALIVLWNAPGIERKRVEEALNTVAVYARRYCGGHLEKSEVI